MLAHASSPDLRNWHRALALWMVQRPQRPAIKTIIKEARVISHFPVTRKLIVALLDNPAFNALLLQYDDEQKRARAAMESHLVDAVESHFGAIKKLEEAGQHHHIAKFTTPIIDRVWPEAEANANPPQVIHIQLGGQFVQQHGGKLENAVDITDVSEITSEENPEALG